MPLVPCLIFFQAHLSGSLLWSWDMDRFHVAWNTFDRMSKFRRKDVDAGPTVIYLLAIKKLSFRECERL